MDILYKTLLFLHVSAGFSSIGLFFVPAFARKGGKLHRRVGLWYTYAMWLMVITAALLCCIQISRGNTSIALFLGFLALLTARPLYFGIAVLRNKKGPTARMMIIDRALRIALGLFSIFMIGNGLNLWGPEGNVLSLIFGALGMTVWPILIKEARGVTLEYSWMEEHIGQMVVAAIAAFTAFLVFGSQRAFGNIVPEKFQFIVWVAPTVVGLVLSSRYKKKLYKRKAEGKPLFD